MGWSNVFANRRIKIVLLAFVIALALLFLRDLSHPFTFGANLGIEFVGGVRVPITLEHSVDSQTMQTMVDAIKGRINKFGLSQAVVRPLGNSEIIVEIPKADASVISSIEQILREQGRFEAIVDGRLALRGEDIIPSAIGGSGGESVQSGPSGAQWSLVFAITGDGEMFFANTAKGKTGFPVLMFLDRPENAVLLVNKTLLDNIPPTAVTDVLKRDNDSISLVYLDNLTQADLAGKTNAIIGTSDYADARVRGVLSQAGFSENASAAKKILVRQDADMLPQAYPGQLGSTTIFSWAAIGLQSAPVLQVEPIAQRAITQYSITGTGRGATPDDQQKDALNEIRALKSILSGGRLPVTTVVGSYYNVSPSLGRQFLTFSMIAVLLAVIAVAILLTLRYRKWNLILPIIATNIIELVLLLGVLGTFGTLDLSAMAGVIALIGTGVDNQIIITDEFAHKRELDEGEEAQSGKEKLARAFFVVFATAGIAFASMAPLFLSGIVEVMGFAIATMLGVIIGVAVTRPAYGVVVEELFKEE